MSIRKQVGFLLGPTVQQFLESND